MKVVLVKPDHSDKNLKEGDVCTIIAPPVWRAEWAPPVATCILVEMVRSYMTGNYWLVLLNDESVTVLKEAHLKKVVNQ
jgi:hypothetical protein